MESQLFAAVNYSEVTLSKATIETAKEATGPSTAIKLQQEEARLSVSSQWTEQDDVSGIGRSSGKLLLYHGGTVSSKCCSVAAVQGNACLPCGEQVLNSLSSRCVPSLAAYLGSA